MSKIIKYVSIIFIMLFAFITSANALSVSVKTTYVNLNELIYSTNNNKDSNYIKEYDSLEDFLNDKNSNKLDEIYITNFLYDGVSTVKSPDLDDFIENDSNDTKIKTLEIKVININTVGNIEFTGEIKGAMIGVNTNDINGDINIILKNVNIDTDSKKAPAIFIYNKDKNYTDHKVTIKTGKNSKNYLEGGKLKKVSLLGSDELDKYSSYYSNDSLTNYNKYSNYYGIYTSDEIKNILFATVEADNEDLQDGDPLYFYKGSGAISSDIDLYFEGEGYLKVTSKNKEGIETKGNLIFSGGTGDYEIYAEDDCLNTTTANSNKETVRNDLTIDVNSLLAIVSEDADEGDAIDSNGKLIINGGIIYAFAHPSSPDAGLDSVNGTYINGGTVIATGNMVDAISSDSKQDFIFASFNKISKDTLIVIKDQNDKVITAFKTSRDIGNLLYSSSDLKYKSYKIYTGGTIDGEETNGLYTKINSYTGGEEIQFNNANNKVVVKNSSNFILVILIGELVLLIGAIALYLKGKKKVNNLE
ncbi:MAG: carbohydrate-binding domain-containing protein [Bacilli bacterium]|nr:carbohydrate-binding domain-containing protein [Bacilli bacterium]